MLRVHSEVAVMSVCVFEGGGVTHGMQKICRGNTRMNFDGFGFSPEHLGAAACLKRLSVGQAAGRCNANLVHVKQVLNHLQPSNEHPRLANSVHLSLEALEK